MHKKYMLAYNYLHTCAYTCTLLIYFPLYYLFFFFFFTELDVADGSNMRMNGECKFIKLHNIHKLAQN